MVACPDPSSARSPTGNHTAIRAMGTGKRFRLVTRTTSLSGSRAKTRAGRNRADTLTPDQAQRAHSIVPVAIPVIAPAQRSRGTWAMVTPTTPATTAAPRTICRRSGVSVGLALQECGRRAYRLREVTAGSPRIAGSAATEIRGVHLRSLELHRHGDLLQDLVQDLLRPPVPDPGVGGKDQPVGQH